MTQIWFFLKLLLRISLSANVSLENSTQVKKVKVHFEASASIQKKITRFYVTKQVANGIFENLYEIFFGDDGTASFIRTEQNPTLDCSSLPKEKKSNNVKIIVTQLSGSAAKVSLANRSESSKVNFEFSAKAEYSDVKTEYYIHRQFGL